MLYKYISQARLYHHSSSEPLKLQRGQLFWWLDELAASIKY